MPSTNSPSTSIPTLHNETQALAMPSTNPPANVESPATLYDETYRGIWHANPHIASLGNYPSLIAHLGHHDPTTDGSFAVCIAASSGTFISKKLYESILQEHRPTLDTKADRVGMWMCDDQTTLGTIFIPIILQNADTGKPFRIVLHAYVLPNVLMGMFISTPIWIVWAQYAVTGRVYGCHFGDGKIVNVQGLGLGH